MRIREIAWAKLNLTLEVLGRRDDGFHELRSLVAFAGVGDSLEFLPGDSDAPSVVSGPAQASNGPDAFALEVEGPFAQALSGANLILNAAQAAKDRFPELGFGKFRLVKTLPVAAGLGGGSADAAAALRLLVQAKDGAVSLNDIAAVTPELGSDVAVCLRSRPSMMTGRGERIKLVQGFPQCGVLLANPGVQLSTAAVYGGLEAEPFRGQEESLPPLDFGGSFEMLIEYASARANDLEPAALKLAPGVGTMLSTLGNLAGVRLVRLSGSGATCLAVFASPREALRAAILLAEREPDWWITAGILGDPYVEM
jgi:4-diphosphocytidyl-2-C-methyl-D-erythritol kinase